MNSTSHSLHRLPSPFAALAWPGLVLLGVTACGPSSTDEEGPRVIATSPDAGATEDNPDTTIRITFDRAIDPATLVAGAITLTPEASGSLSWDAVGKTATFRPDADLAPSTAYTALVSATIADTEGRPMRE